MSQPTQEKVTKSPSVLRITYLYDDGTYKQIDGDELKHFIENFEKAHMCAVIHGHLFWPVKWQHIKLEYDTAKTS